MMLVDPPPFHSGSHNVASELRKRAAQNASETFSKVETPRGEPHPTHTTASLPELAEVHSWAIVQCRASSLPVRAWLAQRWLWRRGAIAESRVQRRAGVGLQVPGAQWP